MSMASRIESVAERLGDFGVVAQYSEEPWDTLEVETTDGLYYFQPGDKKKNMWFGRNKKRGVQQIETMVDCYETDRNMIAAAVYLGLLQRGLLPKDHDRNERTIDGKE